MTRFFAVIKILPIVVMLILCHLSFLNAQMISIGSASPGQKQEPPKYFTNYYDLAEWVYKHDFQQYKTNILIMKTISSNAVLIQVECSPASECDINQIDVRGVGLETNYLQSFVSDNKLTGSEIKKIFKYFRGLEGVKAGCFVRNASLYFYSTPAIRWKTAWLLYIPTFYYLDDDKYSFMIQPVFPSVYYYSGGSSSYSASIINSYYGISRKISKKILLGSSIKIGYNESRDLGGVSETNDPYYYPKYFWSLGIVPTIAFSFEKTTLRYLLTANYNIPAKNYYPPPFDFIQTFGIEFSDKNAELYNQDVYYFSCYLHYYFSSLKALLNSRAVFNSTIGARDSFSLRFNLWYSLNYRTEFGPFASGIVFTDWESAPVNLNYDYYLSLGYNYWFSAAILSVRLSAIRYDINYSMDLSPTLYPEISISGGKNSIWSLGVGYLLEKTSDKSFWSHILLRLSFRLNVDINSFTKQSIVEMLW